MALYRYHALTNEGKKTSGVIDADSLAGAKERLRKKQVMVMKLSLKKETKEASLDFKLLLNFTREMSQLLQAGLPLYESLLTIEEKYRKHKSHSLFLDLCDQLKSGKSLSQTLKRYPKSFDVIYISMVEAAEESGSLDQVCNELTILLTKQQELKKKLLSAMIYPAVLGGFALIVVIALLFFVVPTLSELFEGRALHPLTETVLSLSRFMTSNVKPMVCSLLILFVTLFFLHKKKITTALFQKAILLIPLFKTLIIQSAFIRFSRALSVLLKGGVSLVQGLSLAKNVLPLDSLQEIIIQAKEGIMQGRSLSSGLDHPLVPSLVMRMVKTAEETGRLDKMLVSISEIYEAELERSLEQLTALIQPVLLLILGAIVGVVLLSVLLPLTDVSSFL